MEPLNKQVEYWADACILGGFAIYTLAFIPYLVSLIFYIPNILNGPIVIPVVWGMLAIQVLIIPSSIGLTKNNNALKSYVSHAWINTILLMSPELRNKIQQIDLLQRSLDEQKVAKNVLSKVSVTANPGFIYIMRRSDGIYKIGRTSNTDHRLRQHTTDYGMEFELIRRFVVPDAIEFEKLALSMTTSYEYSEDGRLELRKIPKRQVNEFISKFTKICEASISL